MKKILIIVILCSIVKVEAQTSAFAVVDSLVKIGRYKTALHKLEKMPSTAIANQKTAVIYQQLDNHKKATVFFEKAYALSPNYITELQLAKSYKKTQQYNKAIKIYENIKKRDAENMLATYELAKLYVTTKKLQLALNTYKELIKKDATNANFSYRLGDLYALIGHRNFMINSYLDAYRKDNEHIKSIEKLAVAFTKLRDKDSTNLFIQKGLLVNSNSITLNRLKINQLFRKQKFTKASILLHKLDSLAPGEHYTNSMLGKVYYNLENYDEAKNYFNIAKGIDKEDFKSFEYLGHIALKQNSINKAMYNYYTAISRARKKRDKGYYGLGQAYLKLKGTKDALKMFKKAVEENHKNKDALYQLAVLSDEYYKDKKIAYKLYKRYVDRFEKRDSIRTNSVNGRIKAIKKQCFLDGKTLE